MGKLVGSILEPFTGAKATRDAANQASAAQSAAAREAAELAKFKPYNVTTALGGVRFGDQTVDISYNPALAAYRDRLFGLAPQLLPTDIRQAELDEYNRLRAGSQRQFEELTSQLGTGLFRTGRQGLDIYGAQPETRAFSSALIDRENQLREQAAARVAAELAQSQGLFTAGVGVEQAMLQPLTIGESLGKSQSQAGAAAGQILGGGLQQAAQTRAAGAQAAAQANAGFLSGLFQAGASIYGMSQLGGMGRVNPANVYGQGGRGVVPMRGYLGYD